jgi:Escherichia/Staphylococcus phage prohead protease
MALATRPTAGQVEERTAPDLLTSEDRKIRGRVPYNAESRDLGGFREIIMPGALTDARLDDLVVTVDHAGVPLGRYPTTLKLEDRADGMHWAVSPPESRADVREAIERGDLRAGSWRMVVAPGGDSWKGDVRHIHKIAELRDVSIVTAPAYEAAAVEYRSHRETNPASGQEDTMAETANTETTTPVVEERSERNPAGSLRVNEREEICVISLADLYEQRGFFTNSAATVSWDEYRAFTWGAGTVLTDLNPIRREGVGLGYDRRWVHPAFQTIAVDASTTSVQYLRQSTRTLAGTAVIRALDAVSTKPETATAAEYVTLQLNQVASVQSGIPRIHTAQPLFQSLVEQDLRLSINDGLDTLAIRGVQLAGTLVGKSGTLLVDVRKCITGLQTAGYAPDTLLIDPPGAEALDLLQSSYGTEKFWTFGAGRFAPGDVFGLNIRVGKNAGTAVVDSQAYGRMYMSPVELRAFEADGGLTNKTNVRMELVGEAEDAGGLGDGGQPGETVDRQSLDVDDVGVGEEPLRAAAGRVPEPELAALDLRADAFGVQEGELVDISLAVVLADVRVAVDGEVRHERRDQVGLGGAGTGLVEEVVELAAGDAFAAVAVLAVDVQREARGGVGEDAYGGPDVGDRQCGGRGDRRAGVGRHERQLVFGRRERPGFVAGVRAFEVSVTAEIRAEPHVGPSFSAVSAAPVRGDRCYWLTAERRRLYRSVDQPAWQ